MRLAFIDGLRGVAAFLVMLFHATNTVSNYPVNQLIRSGGAYGILGVSVFFVISGFIIPYSLWKSGYAFTTHWKNFLLKRILRLAPAYAFSIVFTLATGIAVNEIYGREIYIFTAEQLLSNLFFLSPFFGEKWVNPVYWSLAIEFQFYLLICVAFPMLRTVWGRWIFLIISSVFGYFMPDPGCLFGYMPLFLIGISVSLYCVGQISALSMLIWVVMAVCVGVITVGPLSLLSAIITSIIILWGFQYGYTFPKCATTLGVYSYSLYLLHYPIVEKMVRLGKVLGDSLEAQIITLFVVIGVSLIFSRFCYVYVERPALNMVKNIRG